MIDQAAIRIIQDTIKEFFQKTTFSVDVICSFDKEQTVFANINTDEPQILIGEGGQTLAETQHILRMILMKKLGEPFYLDIDINQYKKKKTEYLKELANSIADEVALSKKEKALASMPAYERRIVHMELSSRADVISESIGEEPDRRIIVKPRP